MDNVLFRQITDEANLGVALFDNDQNCIYINVIGRELLIIDQTLENNNLAFRFEDLCERTARLETHNIFSAMTPDFFYSKDGAVNEFAIKTILGTSFIANAYIKKCVSQGQSFTALMFQDITAQKKMQRDISVKQKELQSAFENIVKQNEELKQYDKSKDKFMALATHELRTPLAAVLATAECLKLNLYQSKEEQDELINSIYDETNHLLAIVNDILDLSKIQAGKMDFNIVQSSVCELLERELVRFKPLADSKKVKLCFQADKSSKMTAYFDNLRLSQAIGNVLSNAIKFTPKETNVTVSIQSDSAFVTVVISDQGPGIPKGKELHVFNEFETVGNVHSHHKGTGLGMPISKRLMEIMGGEIKLIQEENKGAIFHIKIPVTKVLVEESYSKRILRSA